MFYFLTLLPDFKDQEQNREMVPTQWAELHVAYVPSIMLHYLLNSKQKSLSKLDELLCLIDHLG